MICLCRINRMFAELERMAAASEARRRDTGHHQRVPDCPRVLLAIAVYGFVTADAHERERAMREYSDWGCRVSGTFGDLIDAVFDRPEPDLGGFSPSEIGSMASELATFAESLTGPRSNRHAA